MISKTDFINSVALSGLTLLVGLAYLIRVAMKGRVRFDRVDQQGGSFLLGKSVMEMGHWGLEPVARFLALLKITPNQVSWASLGFGAVAAGCLAVGHFGLGATFSVLAGFADMLDGMLARLTGVASDAGEVLDAALDRYVEFLFLGGLLVYYRPIPAMQILTLLTLIGSFMVSYSSAKGQSLGVELPSGVMRRPERWFYLVLGSALSSFTITYFEPPPRGAPPLGYPMVGALVLVASIANFSSIHRFWTIAKSIRARQVPLR